MELVPGNPAFQAGDAADVGHVEAVVAGSGAARPRPAGPTRQSSRLECGSGRPSRHLAAGQETSGSCTPASAGMAATITAVFSMPERRADPGTGSPGAAGRTASDLACRDGVSPPGAWGIRRARRLRRRSPGRPAGHPGPPDHARRAGRVSNNPGLTRDAARQRGYGRLAPWLLEVRLTGGPLSELRRQAAAGILPRWRDGLRVPAL
jgi:hypothetical protein